MTCVELDYLHAGECFSTPRFHKIARFNPRSVRNTMGRVREAGRRLLFCNPAEIFVLFVSIEFCNSIEIKVLSRNKRTINTIHSTFHAKLEPHHSCGHMIFHTPFSSYTSNSKKVIAITVSAANLSKAKNDFFAPNSILRLRSNKGLKNGLNPEFALQNRYKKRENFLKIAHTWPEPKSSKSWHGKRLRTPFGTLWWLYFRSGRF